MRRSELLEIVDMTSATFNALVARSVLPFERNLRKGSWSTFHINDVLALALFQDLTGLGLSQARASNLVREHFDPYLDYIQGEPRPQTAELLFGEVAFETSSLKAGKAKPTTFAPIFAVEGRIDAAIAKALKEEGSEGRTMSVTIVNSTATMARILPGFWTAGVTRIEMQRWARFMRVAGTHPWAGGAP